MKQKTGRKLLSFLLTLAMLVGLMPGMGVTAYAASKTVTWNGSDITLKLKDKSFTKDDITFAFGQYGASTKTFDSGGTFTTESGKFTKIEVTSKRIEISGEDWSGNTSKMTWTGDASSSVTYSGIFMGGDGLEIVFTIETADDTHSVTITPGNNMTKTETSGAASQTGLSGAMTPVVYTANTGYKFPDTSDAYTTTNGIAVTRTSDTVVTVSGTPTANTTVTIPNAVAMTYTVTWVNDDGTVLETDTNVPYGTTPTYNGATPTKARTTENTYAFAGWSPAIAAVTGNATYTATYTTISNMRTVTWKNWDGTVLKTDSVALGTMPAYTGTTPTRPDDASYHYTFAGWSPELAVVTDNVTYTAVFGATPIQVQPTTYTVSFFANGGGGVMNPVTVQANTIYKLPACDFTPPAGKQFKAWQLGSTEFAPGDTIKVDSNFEFVALWKDDDGSGESGHGGITGDIVFIGGFNGGADEWYDGGYAPQRAWKVSLAPMVNGSAALGIMTGESTTTDMNVYPTTTIYVFPNANPGFVLDKIIWSYIDGTASYDITEAKNFVMPAMDVVVYVTFKPVG